MGGEPTPLRLIRAIAADDGPTIAALLDTDVEVALAPVDVGATRQDAATYHLDEIGHYVYAGDTAVHIAAAAHRPALVRQLVALGARVDARNRRGAPPLHYAADSHPGWPGWRPADQAEVIAVLCAAGADPNAVDGSGVAALHRAVRTRGAAAVAALLQAGADPHQPNRWGSTPVALATRSTGRGGSGSAAAKAEQAEILRLLAAATRHD